MASTVQIDFNANLARFTSSLDKATADLSKFQSNAERMNAQISKSFAALTAGLTVGFFSSSLKDLADFADNMGKAAQRAGTTAKSFSELAYAASLSDVEVGTLEQALGQLSLKLDEAKKGSKEANEIFSRLKIDPKQFNDSAEALKAVADRFNQLPDGSTKTALAKSLGKAWMDLIPLLNEGTEGLRAAADEAARFGKVTDGEAVRHAQQFNDSLTRVNAALDGLKNKLGSPLLFSLGNFTTAMLEATKETNFFFAAIAAFNTVDTTTANVDKKISELQKKLANLKKFRDELDSDKSFANKLNDFVYGDVKGLERNIEETQAELKVLLKMQKDFQKAATTTPSTNSFEPASPTSIPKRSKSKGTSLKDFQEDFLIEDLQVIGRKTEEEALIIDKWNTFLADSYDEEFGRIQAAMGNDEVAKKLATYRDEAKAIFNETRTPLEKFTAEIQKLKLLYEGGFFGKGPEAADLLGRAVDREHKRFLDSTKVTTDQVTEFWVQAAHNMQDGMSDFFFDVMQGELDDLGTSFKASIDRMVANVLAAQAATQLFGEDFAKGTSTELGGVVGKVFKGAEEVFGGLFNADGNVFDQSGLIPFANGGVVSSATPFAFGDGKLGVMGEAGPEAILPLRRGPDGKLGVQGGAINIQGPLMVVNTPDASSFNKSGPQIAADMHRALARGRRVM